MSDTNAVRLDAQVRIVGTGLLGASIGLALRSQGIDVALADSSPSSVHLASDLGAGRPAHSDDSPKIIVVCVPPDVTADVIEAELKAFPDAVVTDVASVKLFPLHQLQARGVDITHYVGGHPLAGRERGGAISARGDLFLGRPWVVCRDEETPAWALALIEDLVLDLGAVPIEMTPEAHDEAVGLVSHVPQIVSSLMAKQLEGASDEAVRLAGQGVRDVTRIAASSPELWIQILGANKDSIVGVLENLQKDLQSVTDALKDISAPGARKVIAEEMSAGNAGVARLPGKHGQNKRYAQIVVLIDDRPGQLAQLLTELGELNINLEDLRLEHAEGAQMGMVEFSVVPEVRETLVSELEKRNWRVA
ncbi:prephenate dehydrogenase [Aurantimicrobium minutum]|uniref:prephenate dehydrogenase n=1 Tax=Aurantimicrobium minutum TaxID=708131 RepID=UPI002473D964|nr:prephenate dehydrogenase [Aurantimicrobium minutum]MDH6255922.1 prephenate dehydrogenase [Aurantimicrobium minutum]MDH6410060.1 prephenate dehydrogenase [Aurantimicrobium minutum]MDH6424570.1 prephenate dehydrogenase [Aurantimicrobium minutum]